MTELIRAAVAGATGFMGTQYENMVANVLGGRMKLGAIASRNGGPGFNDGDFSWVEKKFGHTPFNIEFDPGLQRFTGDNCGVAIAECESVDLLIIATPANARLEILQAALETGKHVVMEKPFALNSRVGQQMVDLCDRHPNQLVLPAHCYRLWPGIQEIKKHLEERTLGKTLKAHFQLTSGVPAWSTNFADPAVSGGGLFDFAIHFVDLIDWLLGSHSIGKARGSSVISGAIDQGHVIFGGNNISLEFGWSKPKGWFNSQFVIQCERGELSFNIAHGGSIRRNGEEAAPLGDNSETGWLRQLRFCADWIEATAGNKPTPHCTPAEALNAVLRCEQIRDKIGQS